MDQAKQYAEEVVLAFNWLSLEESREVAEALCLEIDPRLSAKPQMEKFAQLLDRFGLRVSAPLLMTLSGRGSKGAAVDVVKELSRRRYDEAKKVRNESGPKDGNAEEFGVRSATAGPGIDAFVVIEAVGREMKGIMQDALEKANSMPALVSAIRMLENTAGDLSWLKSTIDTERQLRRHMEANGSLPEPRAPSSSDPAKERRLIVSQLHDSLQETKVAGQAQPAPASGILHYDEMDHRE